MIDCITSRQQGPRHYHHALTSLPLEPSIHRIATTRWWNSSPLWLRCYCLLYSWKQNETSIALGVRTREGHSPISHEDSRNKAKKVAILRLTRSRYHSRAGEITEAAASMIPPSIISSYARTRITKFGFKAYMFLLVWETCDNKVNWKKSIFVVAWWRDYL